MSNNYYKKPYGKEDINADDFNPVTEIDEDGFEQFIPYYDEDDGEYKYVPAAEFSDAEGEASPAVPRMDTEGFNSVTKQLLDRIELINTEIKSSNKKTEEDKINKLNQEIMGLKEQLLNIKAQNEIKSEIDKFKREFYEKQAAKPAQNRFFNGYEEYGRQYIPESGAGGINNANPFLNDKTPQCGCREKNPAQADNVKRETPEDIEKLVERVKNEIYQEKELDSGKVLKEIEKLSRSSMTEQQIIDKVNSIVQERLSLSCSLIAKDITEKLEQRLDEFKGQNIAMFNETLSKAYEKDEQNSAAYNGLLKNFEELKEHVKFDSDDYIRKQNDFLIRFSEIAEKLEPKNVLDTSNLYAETMLDGISDIRSDIRGSAKDSAEIKEKLERLDGSILSLGGSAELLKENISESVKESLSEQISRVSVQLNALEENIIKTDSANKAAAEDIKSFIIQEIGNAVNILSSDKDSLKEELGAEISSLKNQAENSFSSLKEDLTAKLEAYGEKTEELKTYLDNIIPSLKEEISAGIKGYFENTEALTQQFKESVLETKAELKELFDGKISEIKSELSGSAENILALNSKIEETMLSVKESLAAEADRLNSELSISFLKIKGELLSDVTKATEQIKQMPVEGMLERLEDIENKFGEISSALEGSINSVEGLGISVDTLLRQAEENTAVQSLVSANIESVNAQLSCFADKKEEAESENANHNVLKERIDALAEQIKGSIAGRLAEILAEFKQNADKGTDGAVLNEIAGIKELLLSAQNPDLGYDLSSIYSELKKLRTAAENSSREKAAYEEKYLSVNAEIEELRKELKQISIIAGQKADRA